MQRAACISYGEDRGKERDAAERESGLGPAAGLGPTLPLLAHTRSTRTNPHPPPPLMSTHLRGAGTVSFGRRMTRYNVKLVTKLHSNTTGAPLATAGWVRSSCDSRLGRDSRRARGERERGAARTSAGAGGRRKRRRRWRLRQLVGKHDAVQFVTESSPHVWHGVCACARKSAGSIKKRDKDTGEIRSQIWKQEEWSVVWFGVPLTYSIARTSRRQLLLLASSSSST